MSAIDTVGSASQLQLLQGMQRRGGPGGQDFSAHMKSDFEAAAKAAGVDSSKVPDLLSQIQDAIKSATTGADGTDPRAAVRTAVDGVLKQNGVDPAKFQSALKAQHTGKGHRHHGVKGAGKADQGNAAPAATNPYGDADDDQGAVIQSLQKQVTGTGNLIDIAA